MLVVLTGGEEGLQVGSTVGLGTGGTTDSVPEGGELAISQKVGDVEVDLPQNAIQLGGSEFSPAKRGEVGKVHGRYLVVATSS